LQQYYREGYRRETVYVPNGANLLERQRRRRLLDWDLEPENYVLYLGRFSPEKNCHMLIEAFEQIATDMKLVLAGGTSHTDSYVENMRRHASERIRLFPWISGEDLDELISNAAVFVLPSDLEGLSMALLDAMGAGICVLTSDIPENRELVDGAGFTFRRGDAKDLRRMLELVVFNPGLRKQMAVRGRERIREYYRWPEIAKMIEKSYCDVLGWEAPVRSALAAAAGATAAGSTPVRAPDSAA
jgi:glycosyltransferase involved in cell wall biosynthesis